MLECCYGVCSHVSLEVVSGIYWWRSSKSFWKRNETKMKVRHSKKKNIREKLLKWLAVHSQGLCIGAGLQSVYIRAACSLGRAEPANSSFILPPLLFFLLVHFGTSRRMYVCFLFPCLVAFLGFLLLNRKKKKISWNWNPNLASTLSRTLCPLRNWLLLSRL